MKHETKFNLDDQVEGTARVKLGVEKLEMVKEIWGTVKGYTILHMRMNNLPHTIVEYFVQDSDLTSGEYLIEERFLRLRPKSDAQSKR